MSFGYPDQINMNANHCLKNQLWSLQKWPLSVYLHSREQLRFPQLLDCRGLLSTFEKLINHCLVPAHHHRWIRLPAPCEAFCGSEEQHKNLCQTFGFSFSPYTDICLQPGEQRGLPPVHTPKHLLQSAVTRNQKIVNVQFVARFDTNLSRFKIGCGAFLGDTILIIFPLNKTLYLH